MPVPNGIRNAFQTNSKTSIEPATPLQLDFVDAICSADTGNALSVPELLTSVVNFLSGAGILIGVMVVLGIGILAYGFSKMGSAKGGGGGKGYIVGGGILFVGGVLVYTIPNVVEQSMEGGGACFATITVPPQVVDVVVTLAITL